MHPRNFAAVPLCFLLFTAAQTSHSQNWPTAPIAPEEIITSLDTAGVVALTTNSPWAATTNLLGETMAIRSMVSIKVSALEKAATNLRAATTTNLWVDEAHLTYPAGSKAFTSAAKALTALASLSKKQPAMLDPVQVVQWGGDLAEHYRTLAYDKIVDAARDGISVEKLYGAWKQYLAGQQDLAAGRISNAISHYGSAWKQGAKLRVKLLKTPN